MANKTTISVIMPVFNAEKSLKKSVDSVLDQSFKELELIMIDDGSTDSSGKICDDYALVDKRIKVIHQKNSGVSNARNTGIKVAKGEYIIFLDSDDEMDLNLIEDNLKIIEKYNSDVLIFNFRYSFPDHSIDNEYTQDGVFFGDDKKFFDEKIEKVVEKELMNAPWNKIIRRDLIQKNKLVFDERFSIFEDAIFSLSVCANAKTLCINSKIYHSYNIWETGSLRTRWSESRFLAMKEYYKLEIKYCKKYKNNHKQVLFFGSNFCNSLFAYMQLVSVSKELSYQKKREQIKAVCNDNLVRNILLHQKVNRDLGINKKTIRFFVKTKMVGMIILLYKLKHKVR